WDLDPLRHGVPRGAGFVLPRAEHDDARAEPHLGVRDRPFRAWHDHLLLEAEGLGEPVDPGAAVLVTERGEDVRPVHRRPPISRLVGSRVLSSCFRSWVLRPGETRPLA